MKQVELTKRVYYTGTRYLPILENPKYGKYPLKDDNGKLYFDNVPTPYADSLIKTSPSLFSLGEKFATQYDEYTVDNLKSYAEQRGIKVHPNIGKGKLIEKLTAEDKKDKPEDANELV